MDEIQRLEMIKTSRDLVKQECLTQDDFDLIKKRIICDNPMMFRASLGDVKRAKGMLSSGTINADEYDSIKMDFLSGLSVVDMDEIMKARDFYAKKLITEEEYEYLKGTIFSGSKVKINDSTLASIKAAHNLDALNDEEYDSLRRAVIKGKTIPATSQIDKITKYNGVRKKGLITDSEYEAIRQNLLLNNNVCTPEDIEKLSEYKILLDQGAIDQSDYDERKETILPKMPASLYQFSDNNDLDYNRDKIITKEKRYEAALEKINKGTSKAYKEGIAELEILGDWKDSKALIEKYNSELPEIEKTEKEAEIKAKAKRKKGLIAAACVAVAIVIAFAGYSIVQQNNRNEEEYNNAVTLYEQGSYEKARDSFSALGGFKDSPEYLEKCNKEIEKEAALSEAYDEAVKEFEQGEFDKAKASFTKLGEYSDSKEKAELAQMCIDNLAKIDKFIEDGDLKDANDLLNTMAKKLPNEFFYKYSNALEPYVPYCGVFKFDHGDASAVTLQNGTVDTITARVKGLDVDSDYNSCELILDIGGDPITVERELVSEVNGRTYFVHNYEENTFVVEAYDDTLEIEDTDFRGKGADKTFGYYKRSK